MIESNQLLVYDLTLNVLATWQAHSLSNVGTSSIRLLPRRVRLADGEETDACSGGIEKHHHAVLLAEYLESSGSPLCLACAARHGRRAAALTGLPGYEDLGIQRILRECALCDTHGFLVTGKNAASDGSTEARRRVSKASLVEHSYALAIPSRHAESLQLTTRVGDSKEEGQMLMKVPARSGEYAMCVRYLAAGIGVDTDKWTVVVEDEEERVRRHQAILYALRDQLLSPLGAQTATMLPHLTGLRGAIVIRPSVGRAPLYSPLEADFTEQLLQMANCDCLVFQFQSPSAYLALMNELAEKSIPCRLAPRKTVLPNPAMSRKSKRKKP